jgi:hypothetical protein
MKFFISSTFSDLIEESEGRESVWVSGRRTDLLDLSSFLPILSGFRGI